MSAESRLNVVLMWHMHQPNYRDASSGVYQQPWVYLHGIKDYVDMVAHLEANPQARAVVNFAPILLEQIEDYARQLQGFLERGEGMHDPLLDALACPVLPPDTESRLKLVRACLRANEKRLVDRFPPFRQLVDLARWVLERPGAEGYLSEQFLVDLMVWYHLAWTGETVRRTDTRIQALEEKGGHYTIHDRRELLTVMSELLGGVIGRYRALAEQGRVELSVTPWAHPILPLLIDLKVAREALPDAPLPNAPLYPGGMDRARWHVQRGLESFERHFGFRPRGCWPSEGAVSEATLQLLEQEGFEWAASGETVLFNSIARHPELKSLPRAQNLYRPHRLGEGRLNCFFRDDGLSDLVGFTYSDWHADDAVANLLHHLETIAEGLKTPGEHLVPIILDGENAWEYYPENGYYFLEALYRGLSTHPKLRLTTFSEALDSGVGHGNLKTLVAGSWVYGTLSTWIGDADKNRAWDMLAEAKQVFDEVLAQGRLDEAAREAAERQLGICEGSDWFWWFGDYNPSGTVQDFDRLYRLQLINLYQRLGREPPEYLAHAFSFGGSAAAPAHGGVMRHGQGGH